MQITLDQDEIFEALTAYVQDQVTIKPNQTIEIDLKNGRGENGATATINISAASKPKPEKDSSEVEYPSEDASPFEDSGEDDVEDNEASDVETAEERPALFG